MWTRSRTRPARRRLGSGKGREWQRTCRCPSLRARSYSDGCSVFGATGADVAVVTTAVSLSRGCRSVLQASCQWPVIGLVDPPRATRCDRRSRATHSRAAATHAGVTVTRPGDSSKTHSHSRRRPATYERIGYDVLGKTEDRDTSLGQRFGERRGRFGSLVPGKRHTPRGQHNSSQA